MHERSSVRQAPIRTELDEILREPGERRNNSMAKHRAQRNHFLVGCTLSLIAILGLLSVMRRLSLNTSSVSANVASNISADTPYHSTLTVAPSTPTSPDTPPKPTAAEIRGSRKRRQRRRN
jgi:hypothetical protein